MIAFTTLLLFLLGIVGSVKVSVKADKLLSFFMLASLSVLFGNFVANMWRGIENTLSFTWNSSPSGNIYVDIISNPYNYGLVLPFFAMTLLAVAYNQIFRYEERRSTYDSVLILNLAALLMMITSNNFVQLLSALFIIDILAMFMIKDVEAYRRYILLNIAADMMIFTVLAVINCRVDSLDIRQILLYKKIGQHIDFITLCGLTAIFIKLGGYGLHLGLIKLENIRLHRLQNVLFLSSPISALILLMKFHNLWNASPYFTAYIHLMCALSLGGGFLASLAVSNYKAKIIYWQMMFWALFVEILCYKGFIWTPDGSILLLEMYVWVWGLYLFYLYNGRRYMMLEMMAKQPINRTAINMAFMLMFLMVLAISSSLTEMYNRGNRYYIWVFAVMFILSLTAMLRQAYRPRRKALKVPAAAVKMHWSAWLIAGGLAAFLFSHIDIWQLPLWGFGAAFLLLSRFTPLWSCQHLYKMKKLQNNDVLGKIYKYLLIKPLRGFGRFLWLLIDHLVVEKFIVGVSAAGAQAFLRFFRRLHNNTVFGSIVITALLAVLLWASYQNGRG